MTLLLLRSAEHLTLTRDIRMDALGYREKPQWGENTYVTTIAEQGKVTTTLMGNFYSRLSDDAKKEYRANSVGEVVEHWMRDYNSTSVNRAWPQGAFAQETPGKHKHIVVLTAGEITGVGYHQRRLKELFSNVPEDHQHVKLHENLDDARENIRTISESIPEGTKDAEVLIIVDGHGSSLIDSSIPTPLLDYEGAYRGSTSMKGWHITDEKLSEIIAPLQKKAKVYIIINSCGSGSWLGENETPKSSLNG